MIIGVMNRRGGVGKTVTAQTLGAGLKRKGYRVLLIDLDSQANLTYDTGAKVTDKTALEVLTGACTAEDAIQQTDQGDIIPASLALSRADSILEGKGREHRLQEALTKVKAKYDYIILDTPPALNVITINALTASNYVLLPVQAEVHSLQGITLLYREAIAPVRTHTNPKLAILGILITRYNKRAILSQSMKGQIEATAKDMGTRVFDVPIRECISLKEAQALQRDVLSYAPRSNAAKDYTALINEVEKAGKKK